MTRSHADESDDELLRRVTGQSDVREADHARALLGIAMRESAEAHVALERTRWPMRRAKFRMLPVWLGMPPLIAALVVTSAMIFALAMLLIVTRLVDAVSLVALVGLGYTLGLGVILQLLKDSTDEHDTNRAAMRRRAVESAIDARVAAAAKVGRLERETAARRELVERVAAYEAELARRKRQRKADPKSPSPPPPPASSDKSEVEYGGG